MEATQAQMFTPARPKKGWQASSAGHWPTEKALQAVPQRPGRFRGVKSKAARQASPPVQSALPFVRSQGATQRLFEQSRPGAQMSLSGGVVEVSRPQGSPSMAVPAEMQKLAPWPTGKQVPTPSQAVASKMFVVQSPGVQAPVRPLALVAPTSKQ